MSRKNRHKIKSSGSDRCNICEIQMALQEHHIHGRKGPNANRKDNVMMICPNCHTNIHTGNILVEGWFMTSEGRMLIWRKRGDLPITGQEASPHVY